MTVESAYKGHYCATAAAVTFLAESIILLFCGDKCEMREIYDNDDEDREAGAVSISNTNILTMHIIVIQTIDINVMWYTYLLNYR